MAASFEIEQPGLTETGEPSSGSALYCAQRDVQQAGGLVFALVVEVAENEHGSLAGGERCQRSAHVKSKVIRGWPGSGRSAGAIAWTLSCGELGRPASLLGAKGQPHQGAPSIGFCVRWVSQPAPGEIGPDERGLGEVLGMAGVPSHEQPRPDERTITSGDELGELVVPRHGALPS